MFEPANLADSAREDGETDRKSSLRGKKLQLNIDEMDNISECDLDSNKNTTAKQIAFIEFDLNKQQQQHSGENDKNDTLTEED